ncbi:UAP56-interacting factor-like [Brachionichthys hirsutus]|uniref:UAP56-interacting factor-like n=1 Tax=Brachionichthys hirsutus TaxID=412623 RepID=UPI0036046B4F
MNQDSYTGGRGRTATVPDKVDMSLDDIIRLNKKEQQFKRREANGGRRPVNKKNGRLTRGRGLSSRPPGAVPRAGGVQRGGGAPKLRNRRVPPPPGRRRGQGVITGLAARRPAVLLKRIGTFNRAAVSQVKQKRGQRAKPFVRPFVRPFVQPFVQHPEAQYGKPEVPRRPRRQPDPRRGQSAASIRRPFHLQRRPLPTVQQTQRDARQATFLFRRGLEIQAQVNKPNPRAAPFRARQGRNSATNSGILTVSIDNPTARTQPEPPSAWTLHPPATPPAPIQADAADAADAAEKKIPKGVALQFDINSVGKPQTAMTLNERFRILKHKRAVTAQSPKGSRFVTVG